MSAQEQMRKMLDELMGTGRDGTKSKDAIEFTDFRVCRAFLMATCPYEVLASTRMDMGECPKIHDLALRADFEKAQKSRDHYFDLDALDQLERFFEDCDRKTEISKRRLAETQEELSTEASDKVYADRVLQINEEIGKTLAEAEKLGNEGMVEESLKLMEKVEELKKQKYEADNEYRNSMPASSYQQQKLRVCEVCSAYLGIHDNDRRLADHFGGKLHMGFVFLRERLEELRAKSVDRRAKYDAERKSGRYERRDDRRAVGSRGNSSRDSFDRSRKRSSRSRSRDRVRDKEHRRSRSRSKGSKKRSRSRDKSSRKASSSHKRSRDSRSRSPTSSRHGKSDRHRKSREKSEDERRKKRSTTSGGGEEKNGSGEKERSPPEEGETVDEDDAGSKDSDRPKDSDEDGEI